MGAPQIEVHHDILRLTISTEASVIGALISRYEAGDIYTWLGSGILVSLNPGRPLSNLYSLSEKRHISLLDSLHSKPHIYSVAEKCLRQLRDTRINQSVIISGVSGSGKTEASKHILQYLVYNNEKKHNELRPTNHEIHIEEVLIRSNVILEAFGNAETVYNDNSSRFGRYTTLEYDCRSWSLISARLNIYLLEKPRAVFGQKSILSSFHVFRLLLSSLNEEQWKQYDLHLVLSLEQLQEQLFLTHQQSITWAQLSEALKPLGFTENDIDQLTSLLLAIFLLNTTQFLPASPSGKSQRSISIDESGATAVISSPDIPKVCLAGRLLGLTDKMVNDQFPHQLITRRIQAGHGGSSRRRMTVYSTTCNLSQAREQRDCLVKALYKGLFDTLVAIINDNLSTHSKGSEWSTPCAELGILDLFGFEDFTVNSFEQFCINYANERLHEVFMRVAVTSAYDQLVSEGVRPITATVDPPLPVDQTLLTRCNNSHLVGALDVCAGLLDEVCLLNRVHRKADGHQPSHDSIKLDHREVDWLHRIRTHFIGNSRTPLKSALNPSNRPKFKSPLSVGSTERISHPPVIRVSGSADSFTVEHYTGSVVYSPADFVAKNLDHMPVHLLTWLSDSLPAASILADDLENQAPTCPPVNPKSTRLFCIADLIHSVVQGMLEPSVPPPSTPTLDSSGTEEKMVKSAPLRPINVSRFASASSHSPRCSPLTRALPIATPAAKLHSPSCRPASRRKHTVFGDFKSSVNCLLETLSHHQVSFVRCLRVNLRPDDTSSSRSHRRTPSLRDLHGELQMVSVNRDHVKAQVISGGLLAAATVLNSTYPTRYTYAEFLHHYRALWRLCDTKSTSVSSLAVGVGLPNAHLHTPNTFCSDLSDLSSPPEGTSSMDVRCAANDSIIQKQKRIALMLLMVGLGLEQGAVPMDQRLSSADTRSPSAVSTLQSQFGRSVLFLSGNQVNRLDSLRRVILNTAARLLQHFLRAHHSRVKAARSIQHFWRSKRRTPQHSSFADRIPSVPSEAAPLFCLEGTPVARRQLTEFATYKPHILSRHRILLPFSLQDKCGRSFWSENRSKRLHSLVPYAHYGFPAITDGLTIAHFFLSNK